MCCGTRPIRGFVSRFAELMSLFLEFVSLGKFFAYNACVDNTAFFWQK